MGVDNKNVWHSTDNAKDLGKSVSQIELGSRADGVLADFIKQHETEIDQELNTMGEVLDLDVVDDHEMLFSVLTKMINEKDLKKRSKIAREELKQLL
ncbi:MAG: hypothetical protein WCW25_01655 [Patescibacteria group bacterium]|jgi:hypothetical protein